MTSDFARAPRRKNVALDPARRRALTSRDGDLAAGGTNREDGSVGLGGQQEEPGAYTAAALGHDFASMRVQPDSASAPSGMSVAGVVPLGSLRRVPAGPDDQRSHIEQARGESGTGVPLAPTERAWLEPELGHDLADVRIHTDAGAHKLTGMVGARAATIGSDIYLGPGEYRPGTADYQSLLAHEATHVAQTVGQEGMGSLVGDAGSGYEREADRAAEAIFAGGTPAVAEAASAPYVQRMTAQMLPAASASAMVLTIGDPKWVIDYCSWAAGNVTGVFSDESLWPHLSELEGRIRSALTGTYFQQGHATFSDQEVYDPGILYPNYKCAVTVELLEDKNSVQVLGGGATATLGKSSSDSASSQSTYSHTTTGSVSATGGGSSSTKSGGNGAPEVTQGGQGSVTGSVSASTTTGSQNTMATGGSVTGGQQSATQLITSNVFVRVTVRVDQFDSFATYHSWSKTSDFSYIGTARYTLPTLAAPVATPVAAPAQ